MSPLVAECAWARVREVQAAWGLPVLICRPGGGPAIVALLGYGERAIVAVEWDDDDPVTSADALAALCNWLARCGPRETT